MFFFTGNIPKNKTVNVGKKNDCENLHELVFFHTFALIINETDHVHAVIHAAAHRGADLQRMALVGAAAAALAVENGHHCRGHAVLPHTAARFQRLARADAAASSKSALQNRHVVGHRTALRGDGVPAARPGTARSSGAKDVAAPELGDDGCTGRPAAHRLCLRRHTL